MGRGRFWQLLDIGEGISFTRSSQKDSILNLKTQSDHVARREKETTEKDQPFDLKVSTVVVPFGTDKILLFGLDNEDLWICQKLASRSRTFGFVVSYV